MAHFANVWWSELGLPGPFVLLPKQDFLEELSNPKSGSCTHHHGSGSGQIEQRTSSILQGSS